MMKKLLAFCICLGVCLAGATRLHAQDYLYATGLPTFTAQVPIENGFINVNNGGIHIEIPLATHAQRGTLQLDERLVYDSRIWKIVDSGGSFSWQPSNVPNSMGGWRFTTGLEAGTVSEAAVGQQSTTSGSCQVGNKIVEDLTETWTQYYSFEWTDPQGTVHLFPFFTSEPVTVCNGDNTHTTPSASGYAVDGSGYVGSVTNYTTLTVYDPSGNQVYPTITDKNGNTFSKDGNGNLVDTLGRTPVLMSTSGNNIFYDVLGFNGVRNRYTVTTETITFNTLFDQEAVSEGHGSFTAIQSITLPDGSAYSFTYDSGISLGNYGELTSVTLPSGGTISYTYTNFLDSFQNQNRWINTRVKDGGTTTFTPATISVCGKSGGCQEQVTVTSPAPGSNDTVYSFFLDSKGAAEGGRSWNTSIVAYQGSSTSGGTPLVSQSTSFSYANTQFEWGGYYNLPATIKSTTTLNDVGLSTQTVTTLDSTGSRPVSVKKTDFYSGTSPTSPLQQTAYTFGYEVNGVALPTQITVQDGSGNQVSQTSYTYDETSGAGHAALVTTSGLLNHNSVTGTRGNLTTIAQWLNTTGGTISTQAAYDDAGTVQNSTDPNGMTSYVHDGATDTFTTSVTAPTPSSGVAVANTATVDTNSGLIVTQTDPNGTQIAPQSYDMFGRPTAINVTSRGTIYAQSAVSYTSTGSSEHDYQNTSTYADTETQYDSYGRVSRVAVANGQSTNPGQSTNSWYQNDTCYDTSGRVSFRSYRYQGNESTTPKVCSGAGDSYTYDALNRVKTITHSDGTTISYTYTGRATQVADENGVTRISQADGLGRLIEVCEISSNSTMPNSGSPVSCGTDIAGTGFVTSYAYSLANHEATVTQGQQTRVFQTDSLGRTVLTQEPERGQTSFSYAYNSSGLLVTRTRPAPNQKTASTTLSTMFQYDSLGRLTEKSYSDTEAPVFFGYDIASITFNTVPANSSLKVVAPLTNPAGRLAWTCRETSAQNGCTTENAFSYDPLGRVIEEWSSTPSFTSGQSRVYTQNFTYDELGNLLSSTDGNNVMSTYTYTVANEVNGITSSLSDATHPSQLVSNVMNGPAGTSSFLLGNGLSQIYEYDGLDRLEGGWLCSGAPSFACSTQQYGFFINNHSGTQLTSISDNVTGQNTVYGYDEFNRLTSANFKNGQTTYSYTYDRYGNRWAQAAPQGGSTFNQSFNPATNQITGYSYDAAGNLLSDGNGNTYTYDGDGNVLSVNGTSTQNVYDASNNQVWTSFNGSLSEENIINLSGQLATTWIAGSASPIIGKSYWGAQPIDTYYPGSSGESYFDHFDWLGTKRMSTTYNGSVYGTYTSLPFGDGWADASGHDDNTFDDFAEMWDGGVSSHATFREYSHGEGRWMSPDPYDGSYDFSSPQSLNRYSYVTNNPLSLTDPQGLDGDNPISIGGAVGGCVGVAASGGADIEADIGCGWDLLEDIVGLFSGPSFQGSLQPRPSATGSPNWDGNFGESLGIPTTIPQTDWGIAPALGLPDAGCEFGACGSGPSAFGPGGSSPVQTGVGLLNDGIFTYVGLLEELGSLRHPYRLFGTRWCGPGGGGSTTSNVDAACRAHDLCYGAHGLSFLPNLGIGSFDAAQTQAAKACNQSLYNAVKAYPNEHGSQAIQLWLTNGVGIGILAPGTSVVP